MSCEEATTLIDQLTLTSSSSSSSTTTTTTTTISLLSSDGVTFEVKQKSATVSHLLKRIIDDNCAGSVIPLPNVYADILEIVIGFCNRHADSGEIKEEDRAEVKAFDNEKLFEVIRAANYLEIKELLDLACQTVAETIKDLMPEQVREIFGVECDFTEEEEQAVRSQNAWAFELSD